MAGAGARIVGDLGQLSGHDGFAAVIKDMQNQIHELEGQVSALMAQRDNSPLMSVPDLHSEYVLFRNTKGDKQNTITALVTRDRQSSRVCANAVPRKGVGGGYAVKQYLRDIRNLVIIIKY